jgi:alpha-tubulin suppressor-like RCC1 family protein
LLAGCVDVPGTPLADAAAASVDGAIVVDAMPPADAGPPRIIDLSDSWESTCATYSTGDLYCWGRNDFGQLGNTTLSGSEKPIHVKASSSMLPLSEVIAAASGDHHSCALRASGEVWCWGTSDDGQLGDDTVTTTARAYAAPVMNLSDVASISTRGPHVCAISTNGELSCWGRDGAGELGNGAGFDDAALPTASVLSGDPIGDAAQVSVGRYNTRYVSTTGVVACFGWIVNSQSLPFGVDYVEEAAVITLPAQAAEVSTGVRHSCARLIDGRVFCWGLNKNGQIGDGTSDTSCTHADDGVAGDCAHYAATQAMGLEGCQVEQLGVGQAHSCARCASGQVRCWGAGDNGRLGNGGSALQPIPVTVLNLTDATDLTVGNRHACVLRSTGEVSCWGDNSNGSLATVQTSDATSPVPVTGLPDPSTL